MLSCGMHRRVSGAGAGKPVLLDQRIKNKSAVNAAQHGAACGVVRSRFRDHESFTFWQVIFPPPALDGMIVRARM